MEKVLNMTYASSLTDLCEINSSFDSGVLRIAYTGKNRNNSFISKEAFEKSMKTMYNCPIVCNYDRDTDTLGGHDMDVVKDADGNLRIINMTTPVGCIPESARYWWEEVDEDDGSVHEYLYTEALLWKRQEAYQKIKRDGITAHSMEITVKSGKSIDGVYHIEDFEFTAFALIGVEPCFESSAIELFSKKDLKDQLSEMMQDLKECMNKFDPMQSMGEDKHPHEFAMEGGRDALDEQIEKAEEIVEEAPEQDKFELDGLEQDSVESNPDTVIDEEKQDESAAFELDSNVHEELCRAFDDIRVEKEWGSCRKYCMVDYDMAAMEVYCWDTEDWLLYGFAFEMNGDSVDVKFDTKKRMKYAIVEFDNGEQASPFVEMFSIMEEKIHMYADIEQKYEAASGTITSLEAEVTQLKEFKANVEKEAIEADIKNVFDKFDELSGTEMYEALRNAHEGMTPEDIEEKCFAICGRLGKSVKFSNAQRPKIGVMEHKTEKKPYGGIVEKYTGADNEN